MKTLSGTLAGFIQDVCPPSRALRKEAKALKEKGDT